MAKKSFGRFNFLFLLVLFLGIVLPLLVIQISQTTNFKPKASEPTAYWVTYGALGTPSASVDTAKELLNVLSSPDNKVSSISRIYRSGWDSYYLQFGDSNNFPIKAGEGYIIQFEKLPPLNYYSKMPYTPLTGFTYNLLPTNNYISIPRGLTAKFKNVESVCQSLISQSLTPVYVAFHTGINYVRYDSDNYWTYHNCGTSENNAPVVPGTGYWIRVNTAGTWKI